MTEVTATTLEGGPVLVVVPCSAAKHWQPAPAGELYTGSFYKLARAAGDALVERLGGRVVILSALHGLLELEQLVEPYDQRMGEPGSVAPSTVALQLVQQLQGAGAQLHTVVALLPRGYRVVLEQAVEQLPVAARPRVVDVLEGAAGVGYQRQRLAQLRNASVVCA